MQVFTGTDDVLFWYFCLIYYIQFIYFHIKKSLLTIIICVETFINIFCDSFHYFSCCLLLLTFFLFNNHIEWQ